MSGGMFLPGYWKSALFVSLLCEVFEYWAGWRARWVLDPLANLFGYLIGHLIYIDLHHVRWIARPQTTIVLLSITFLLFYLNRPCMIPDSETWY